MNDIKFKEGDKVRIVYKPSIIINRYTEINLREKDDEFIYNNQEGIITYSNPHFISTVKLKNKNAIVYTQCLELIEKPKITERIIYVLTARTYFNNINIIKDKCYISNVKEKRYNGYHYKVNNNLIHESWFKDIIEIKETIINNSNKSEPIKNDIKMNNKELTLEIIKKSLMDIEWLEESDAKDIYEALEKNILSNIDIKPLEVKEEPELEAKEELPTNFILKVDKSNKNEIDAVLFVYNKYLPQGKKYNDIITGMIYSHNEHDKYIKNFDNYESRTFLATRVNIKFRNRQDWPVINFETFSKIFKNELKEYYEKGTTTELPF